MVHIKDCSGIDLLSGTSSESKGSDYSIDEEKIVKKRNKNAKDAGSNVCGLNANLTSEEFFSFGENTSSDNNMDEELEKWIVAPRISTSFSYGEDRSLHSSKTTKNKERTKQFQMEIFFASIIEMLCDGEFEGLNIQFREGIILAYVRISTAFEICVFPRSNLFRCHNFWMIKDTYWIM